MKHIAWIYVGTACAVYAAGWANQNDLGMYRARIAYEQSSSQAMAAHDAAVASAKDALAHAIGAEQQSYDDRIRFTNSAEAAFEQRLAAADAERASALDKAGQQVLSTVDKAWLEAWLPWRWQVTSWPIWGK